VLFRGDSVDCQSASMRSPASVIQSFAAENSDRLNSRASPCKKGLNHVTRTSGSTPNSYRSKGRKTES
jgi:hypothetical protein